MLYSQSCVGMRSLKERKPLTFQREQVTSARPTRRSLTHKRRRLRPTRRSMRLSSPNGWRSGRRRATTLMMKAIEVMPRLWHKTQLTLRSPSLKTEWSSSSSLDKRQWRKSSETTRSTWSRDQTLMERLLQRLPQLSRRRLMSTRRKTKRDSKSSLRSSKIKATTWLKKEWDPTWST